MSASAAPPIAPEAIFELAQGFMASKLLFVASDINLFEQLGNGPLSADELAAGLGLPVRSVGVVANAMVAVGMLRLADGRYRNADVTQTFLAGKGPNDIRPFLTLLDRLVYPTWKEMAEAVRRDGNKETILEFSSEDQAIFSAGVEAASTGGAIGLAMTYDFGSHRRLLDIGRGTGSFLRIIGNKHPHLELTLLDLPNTVAYARSRFTAKDAERINTISGNIVIDALPTGFDAMLLSHVMHCLDAGQNRQLLKRSYEAAGSGARLLIVEFFLNDTKTAPLAGTLMSGEFLLRTSGLSYSATEIRRLGELAGWRIIDQRPLAGPVGLMVLEK